MTSQVRNLRCRSIVVGWLRLKKVLKPANHSTNISFGRKLLYNHIKHLKGGHTLSLPIFSPICIN